MWSSSDDKHASDSRENTYKYSTDSEEILLKETSDTRSLLVGSESSSRHNHMASGSPTNESTPSVYDPTTATANASAGNVAPIALTASHITAEAIGNLEQRNSNTTATNAITPTDVLRLNRRGDRFMTPAVASDRKKNDNNNSGLIHDVTMINEFNTHVRQPNKRRKSYTCREKILAAIATILLLLLIIFISLYARKASSKGKCLLYYIRASELFKHSITRYKIEHGTSEKVVFGLYK